MSPFARLADELGAGRRAALVTLARVEGSAPREEGAWMLVRADGRFTGTIGGGALEWQALALAQAALEARPGASLRPISLGPDTGQCCGGRVTLLIETFVGPLDRDLAAAPAIETRIAADGQVSHRPVGGGEGAAVERLPDGAILRRFDAARVSVALFGAGHTGRALALALAPLPVTLAWVDSRADAFPAHVPGNATTIATTDVATAVAALPPGTLVYVMTHSHALDLDVVATALKAQNVAHVGLIGSATKRARFLSRLRAMAIATERLVCPIGIGGITSKHPAVIAASVAADILVRAEALRAAATSRPARARIV